MKTSKSLKIGDLSFRFVPGTGPCLGLIVSKKYGDSVRRNLFKRRCRSIFKTILIDNNILYSVIVRPVAAGISYKSINKSFTLLYSRLVD